MPILRHPVGFRGGDAVVPGIVGFTIPARGGLLDGDLVVFPALEADLVVLCALSGSIVWDAAIKADSITTDAILGGTNLITKAAIDGDVETNED